TQGAHLSMRELRELKNHLITSLPHHGRQALSKSLFSVRGVVEGFYGLFYSHVERNDLIRFLGRHGFNLYVYGPKNDDWHRERWREPYPDDVMEQFEETIQVACDAGVTFCFSLSPGLSIRYSLEEEYETLLAKYSQFSDRGVRAFALLLDDIRPTFQHEEDSSRYRSYAEAQADLCNRLYAWLQARTQRPNRPLRRTQREPTESEPTEGSYTLSMCPTQYHGRPPFGEYLEELGRLLDPAIDVFYTGPDICSTTITVKDAEAFGQVLRRPPLIWDNYPVNDMDRHAEMHLGPVRGREASLYRAVKGMVVNPMNEAEASKIPLLTIRDYLDAPHKYDPSESWEMALREIGGDRSYDALRRFAEHTLTSCLSDQGGERLEQLVGETLRSLRDGDTPSEGSQGITTIAPQRGEVCCAKRRNAPATLHALTNHLATLLNATFFLKIRLPNLALRAELAPWIEALEYWCWMAQRATRVLYALERGERDEQSLQRTKELMQWATQHPKRVAGDVLLPLAEYVIERVEDDNDE
ncbi:MAG: protein O-GlcNAcase, partial [Ardenticatenaceae bacterium]